MKILFRSLVLGFLFTLHICLVAINPSFGQEAQYPFVKRHGGVYHIPEATVFPDPELQYKLVVDIKEGSGNKTVSASLNNLARLVNLHGLGGVPRQNLEVIAVVHGEATAALLSDVSYENRFGIMNPNTDLIDALVEAGIKLFVCGQSLHARKFDARELNPKIQISISAVTLLSTYQLKGYAVISY